MLLKSVGCQLPLEHQRCKLGRLECRLQHIPARPAVNQVLVIRTTSAKGWSLCGDRVFCGLQL